MSATVASEPQPAARRTPLAGVFVVIPAYNEGRVLAEVVGELAGVVPTGRVVVVDDGSSDETAEIARAAGARVVRHAINRGQGAALATGIAAALKLGADIVVTFDADGQHDPADIPAMIEPIARGEADVVLGSRFLAGAEANVPALRRLLLKAAVAATRATSRLRVTDAHNGFRAISGEAARRIRIRQSRMEHASEILDEVAAHQLRYVERPVRIHYSDYSVGKGQKNRDALKLALRILYYKVAG